MPLHTAVDLFRTSIGPVIDIVANVSKARIDTLIERSLWMVIMELQVLTFPYSIAAPATPIASS